MKRRELLVALAAGALAEGSTSLAQAAEAKFTDQIELPKPNLTGTVSLEEAIAKRRSVRRFASKPLPVEAIGQLMWAGQGITNSDGKRAAPAAGALYALELYVVTATEVMHYLPEGHRAEKRASHDLRPELRALAVNQASVEAAPALLVVAADPSRLTARYGGRANLYADLEVGHATQNMLLQVVALGLVAVPVGAVDGAPAARKLGLPRGQTVLYLIPVGYPA
ncbi:SagB/ThcOx family dehydrogenase [Paraburkholderia atlantica]|uniref:SagB-type dehydrogenase domain protein n=1 Tax=Paraburkholderia atlantica TaxID=2654982 RepID=D5WIF1_PARAM|nr:SagB/ThcOx family dehydrogenase [Paraburkholderia atlantica]ADG18246.1 SagB-type dehydrogenase domain protein [Paraburkholderia atlantica]MBB5504487.1 SagB-type dehydrogenase family enzyme [Paraburkholderia atlantica]